MTRSPRKRAFSFGVPSRRAGWNSERGPQAAPLVFLDFFSAQQLQFAFHTVWRSFRLSFESEIRSMSKEFIRIGGAREHNLKNLTLNIPRDRLVVITGLSGSGKSSLAFDTIYAEGQRKYVESLSAYARQFLDQLQKPDVDFIEGL